MTEEAGAPSGWLRANAKLVWTTALSTVVSAIIALIFAGPLPALWHSVFGGGHRSVARQLEDIDTQAAALHLHPVERRVLDLHGSGRNSYLRVYRSTYPPEQTLDKPISDEIRIYDEGDNGDLAPAFEFQPRPDHRLPFRVELQSTHDDDGDGRPEILGTYDEIYADATIPYPFVITWNEVVRAYRFTPLIARPPRLAHLKGSFEGETAFYRRPVHLVDRAHGHNFVSYSAEAATIFRLDSTPRLVAGFVAKAAYRADPRQIWQILGWRLDLQSLNPEIIPCELVPGVEPVLVRRDPARAPLPLLERAWARAERRGGGC